MRGFAARWIPSLHPAKQTSRFGPARVRGNEAGPGGEMLGKGRGPHGRSPGRRPPMRSPMLAAQHRPPCGRSPPGPARLCSAPPARHSARSACAAVAAPPPRSAAAPRAPGTPPARRHAARAVTHRATRVMHSRARERPRQRHTLPHSHSHTPGPLATSHTPSPHAHSHGVTLSHRVTQGQIFKLSYSHLSCFLLWNVPCGVIHYDTLRYSHHQ